MDENRNQFGPSFWLSVGVILVIIYVYSWPAVQ